MTKYKEKSIMKAPTRIALFSALLLLAGLAQAADPIMEREPNNPAPFAQFVDLSSGSASVQAVLGQIVGTVDDVDFFYFSGKEGDVVTIDIDGAMGGLRSFDSLIALFESAPGFPMLILNDDAPSLDPGSISLSDSRIDNFRLPKTGNYIVGVSNYPRYFQSGATLTGALSQIQNGDYTLVLTRATTRQVQQISIDIKPGSTGLAPINPKSGGKIPVALLSSTNFNALTVNQATLTFGRTGSEASLSQCGKDGEDVNGDGLPDLVCHFDNQKAGFQKGDTVGIVHGQTTAGAAFEGNGFLKVVPEKR